MPEQRLGDDIDDFCIKCKRLSNHLIVSLVDGAAAKVRCRSCYSEHDYRREQAPPTKKELKKMQLAAEAAAAANGNTNSGPEEPFEAPEPERQSEDPAAKPETGSDKG